MTWRTGLTLALSISISGAAWAQQEAEDDKGVLTRFIENRLSSPGAEVDIRGFAGALSTKATIDRLSISDRRGEWLIMNDVVLDWDRSALLGGRVIVQELSVSSISAPRRPLPGLDVPAAQTTPFRIPSLPVSVDIDKVDIPRATFGPEWVGEEIIATLSGEAHLDGQTFATDIEAARLNGAGGVISLRSDYQEQSRQLLLDLSLEEESGGLLASKLGLPGAPDISATLQGEGLIDDFTATLDVATGGISQISGEISLDEAAGRREVSLDLGGDFTKLTAPQYHAFFGNDARLRADLLWGAEGGLDVRELVIDAKATRLEGEVVIGADGWPERFALRGALGSALEGGVDRDTPVPVLLPIPGAEIRVGGAKAEIAFDAAKGPDWTGIVLIKELQRPEVTVRDAKLELRGQIEQPSQEASSWQLAGDYVISGVTMTDPALAEALGADIEGDMNLSGKSGEPTLIDSLSITGPGLDAFLSGRIAGKDARFATRLDLTLDTPDLSRFAALLGQQKLRGEARVSARADIRPLDRAIDLSVRGETSDLAVENPRIDPLIGGEGSLILNAGRGPEGTEIRNFALNTKGAQITAVIDLRNDTADGQFSATIPDASVISKDLRGAISLDGRAKRLAGGATALLVEAEIPEGKAHLAAKVAPGSEDYASDLIARFEIEDLSVYSDVAGRPLQGRANGSLRGDGVLGLGRYDLGLQIASLGLQLGQPQADALLGGAAAFDGRLKRLEDGTLVLDRIAILTPTMSGRADARISKTGVTARLDAKIPRADILHPDLSGPIEITGSADQQNGGATAVNLQARAPDADLELRASLPPTGADVPIRYNVMVTVERLDPYGDIIGSDLRGAVWATADGSYDVDTGAGTIDLTGRSDNLVLRDQVPALNDMLRGRADLRLQAQRDAVGRITIDRARIASAAGHISASGGVEGSLLNGRLDGQVHDLSILSPELSGRSSFTIEAAPADQQDYTDVTLSATAPGSQISGRAQVAPRDEAYRTSFDLGAQLIDLRPWARLLGSDLAGGATVDIEGDLEPLTGAITTSFEGTTSSPSIGLPIVDLILSGRGNFGGGLSRSAQGDIQVSEAQATLPNLEFSADGSRSAAGLLDARFKARVPDAAILSKQFSGQVIAEGSATIEGDSSRIEITATGLGGLSTTARGRLLPGGRLDLDIAGQAPLALANRAISPQALSGTADFNLSVDGPPSLSSVSGRISTSGSRLSIPSRGAALTGITGDVRLAGETAFVDLTSSRTGGGDIAMSGQIDLTGQRQANLRVRLGDVLVRDPELYETRVDGELTVTGPLRGGANIAGTVYLEETVIRVPERSLSGLVKLARVRHLAPARPVARTLNRASLTTAGIDMRLGGDEATGQGAKEPSKFFLDIDISAPNRIFVRGRGVDAELGGNIKLGGTIKDVIPAGRLDLIRGRITILQQRFELDEGYASIEGDFTPYIYLSASTEREEVTTFITFEGDLADPEITFSSAPELPQDEVLAQLIFGRDLTDVSPLQAVQLASAINLLAGGEGGGFVGRLRNSVNLDDLDIIANEDGDALLRAGKYLNEDIYAAGSVGSDGTSRIDLNIDLTSSITATGSTDTDGQSSIGLFFERDY